MGQVQDTKERLRTVAKAGREAWRMWREKPSSVEAEGEMGRALYELCAAVDGALDAGPPPEGGTWAEVKRLAAKSMTEPYGATTRELRDAIEKHDKAPGLTLAKFVGGHVQQLRDGSWEWSNDGGFDQCMIKLSSEVGAFLSNVSKGGKTPRMPRERAVTELRSTLESLSGLVPDHAFDALHTAVRHIEEARPPRSQLTERQAGSIAFGALMGWFHTRNIDPVQCAAVVRLLVPVLLRVSRGAPEPEEHEEDPGASKASVYVDGEVREPSPVELILAGIGAAKAVGPGTDRITAPADANGAALVLGTRYVRAANARGDHDLRSGVWRGVRCSDGHVVLAVGHDVLVAVLPANLVPDPFPSKASEPVECECVTLGPRDGPGDHDDACPLNPKAERRGAGVEAAPPEPMAAPSVAADLLRRHHARERVTVSPEVKAKLAAEQAWAMGSAHDPIGEDCRACPEQRKLLEQAEEERS